MAVSYESRRVQLLNLLKQQPMTTAQLAEAMCMSFKHAGGLIRRVRKEGGLVYIKSYIGTNVRPEHVYAFGAHADATHVLKYVKRTVEKFDEEADRERLKKLSEQTKPFRHPQDIAFFGDAR